MYKEKIKCLNLIGDNEEDLRVISAYLQDSIVVMKDMLYYDDCNEDSNLKTTFLLLQIIYTFETVTTGVPQSGGKPDRID